jgi:hypothetical protein
MHSMQLNSLKKLVLLGMLIHPWEGKESRQLIWVDLISVTLWKEECLGQLSLEKQILMHQHGG